MGRAHHRHGAGGLTPAKALIDCAEYYLKLENFDCHKQVMEYHLVGME